MNSPVIWMFSALLLAGCQSKSGVASDDKERAENTVRQSNFDAVMQHLDIGGKTLHFEDHAGRREIWIGLIELTEKVFRMRGPMEDIDAAGIVDDLGVCGAAASGRSLMEDGDHWLVRSYSHYPDGLPEVFELLGKAKPFGMGSLPATTDVAIECSLDARDLPEVLRGIAKHMARTEEVESVLKEELPIGLTWEGLLSQTDMDVLLGVEFAKSDLVHTPVVPKAFVLKLGLGNVRMAVYEALLTKRFGEAKIIGGLSGWEGPVLDTNVPNMDKVRPVVLMEDGGTLLVVSSREHWESVNEGGDTLGKNAVYQAATNHFPESGNMQVYLSPMVAEAAREWMGLAIKETRVADGFNDVLVKLTPGKPWSYCMVCGETGVLTMAEMPFALDVSATTALAVLPGTSGCFVGARYWKKGSDRAGCILNIRNIQQAIRSYHGMNAMNFGDEINWDEIVGPGKFMEKAPVCPGGGVYSFVRTLPEVGVLACTCSNPEHEPSNHEDW